MILSNLAVCVLALITFDVSEAQRKISRNVQVGADVKTGVNFDCPEEFGYYPHPTDCTQYYVCVFGGALLESCTGGLMYSHELQTCDWPRNVGCDGLEISGPPSALVSPGPTSRSRERERDREEQPRQRYSPQPPPPPAQPAAVVTSRGQPRQLHHTQQEIIKHQQQLYADAEEQLPPAEEIESDRQQRVYRGQPSTIGQVQRDRDGLRHTNAIPSYSGRGEKIGVISFGTQQHYSKITDVDDFLHTNDLTVKRRRKRQITRSHHRDADLWLNQRNKNPYRIQSIPLQPSQLHKQPFQSSHQPQYTQSNDDFQPFTPDYKRTYQQPQSVTPNTLSNYNYFSVKPTTKVPLTYQDSYSYFNIGQKPKYYDNEPIRHTVEYNYQNPPRIVLQPQSQPSYVQPVQQQKPVQFVNTTRNLNDYKYITEVVTKGYAPQKQVKPPVVEEEDEYYDDEEEEPVKNYKTNNTNFDRPHDDYFRPPPSFYKTENKYEHIKNPFASPDFNYDKFLDGLRGTTTTSTTVKPRTVATKAHVFMNEPITEKVVVNKQTEVRTVPFNVNKTNVTKHVNSKVPVSDYYYYEYEDVSKPKKIYSSQIKSNQKVKKPIDYEYYYEDYEYPDTKEAQKTHTQDDKNSGEIKYSARYQEKPPKKVPDVTTTTTTQKYVSSTTPKVVYTVRQRTRGTTKATTPKSTRGTSTRTTLHSDNDTKHSKRTSPRGRGSAHYSASGNVANNEVTVNVNRGTPASRSRPTLKPSTSIVSKAQEFVDIYRYPPRRPDPIYPQPQPDKTAAKCRKDVCLLPDCSCGGKEIPGDIPVEETPQMVLITFDDAVNDLNKQYYIDLFENGRRNPNGCPISATFYVSHEWTDYSQVQNLYADGHELASHTVSHSFGEQFSQKKWTREVAGQREILAAYGGVKLEDVRGMRAPFLSVGGNKMFKMLYDSNFTYDSSMPIYENKPPSWPYTLDYKLFHDCMIPPCPTRSYPGVWEVPMVMWQDLNGGRCSMGDACSNPPDADGVFKMLTKNFQRHYTTNRAPFGLFYHAAWFTQPHHKEGFIQFIDSILQMKDVWLVTNWQALQWVRDPTPISRLGSFQPFQCDFSDRPKRCNNPKVCNLWHKSGVRYMRTCQPCPDIYPWTGNTGIRSSRIDNDIED